MNYRIVLLPVVAVALVACGSDSGQVHAKAPTLASSETSAATSGELWDTDLTYGHPPDPDATGIERGRQVYNQQCAICHAEGIGMAGTESLRRSLMARGEKELDPILANRTDLQGAVIRTFVRHGVKSMPHFRKTEVSDDDLDFIVEYLTRNNPSSGE